MFEHLNEDAQRKSFEVLDELAKSTPQAVQSQRAHERITMKVSIVVQPGNRSQRGELRLEGISGDVSAGGLQALLPEPLHVGDIYRVAFDDRVLDLAPQYVICKRCRVVRDEAFEAGLAFLRPIDVGTALRRREPESLI